MGFISLPVSAFLYWLMLRSKKEIPFPKSGFFLLLIAGAISVGVSVVLNLPLSGIVSFFRLGILSDLDRWTLAIKENPAAISEMVQNAVKNTPPTFFWIPVIYHTVTNALIASAPLNRALDVLGTATAISHIVAVVLTVILVFRWQKKRMLDIQIQNDNIIQTEGEYNGQPKG